MRNGEVKKSKKNMVRFKKSKTWNLVYLAALIMVVFLFINKEKQTPQAELEIPLEWVEQIRQRRILERKNNLIKNKIVNTVLKSQLNELNEDVPNLITKDEYLIEDNISFSLFPPNPDFIFHNKLPKSGSSTMNNILKVLKLKNKFNFLKVYPNKAAVSDKKILIDFLRPKIKPPFLLLKHHYWVNFTEYNSEQPTFINVMRDPIDWFTSRFYFSRFGWNRKPGCREEYCHMPKKDFNMDIDECVSSRHKECMLPWPYIPFFCGSSEDCLDTITEEEKIRSYEIAKRRLVENFFFVGIVEQFEDTLNILEKILPSYFNGAVEAWKGEFVQEQQNKTRTRCKKEMSEKSKKFFENGPLKYEIKLYKFARELLRLRMQSLGLKPVKK